VERTIISLIEKRGPLTGSEIRDSVPGRDLDLWKTCSLSKHLETRILGKRYLRLDRRVDGYARLSPSILREFLTYSVVGLSGSQEAIERRGRDVMARIEQISRSKLELARRTVSGLRERFDCDLPRDDDTCFIVAGDIVYNMAHDMPRPERSTGKLVSGSDIDLIVILRDRVPDDAMQRLDECIYKEKYRLLVTPSLKEELDYIVKKVDRVREQMAFDTFRHMVACKILREGILAFGSDELYHAVKGMLDDHGISEALARLEDEAAEFRKRAEDYLLRGRDEAMKDAEKYLFFPIEESEEFE
jgi:hypothetical protein